MNKVKEYMNGSMEPEAEKAKTNQETDLIIASKTFNTLGIVAIAGSLVLFPVLGFHITILLFGVLFIGMSIIMKNQDEILHKISDKRSVQDQESHETEQSTDARVRI